MLQKLFYLSIIASCIAVTGGQRAMAASNEPSQEEIDAALFKKSLEKIDPMNPDYRFRRDAAVVYAGCNSIWWAKYGTVRDCYRNGVEELSKGTPFDQLIIKTCELSQRETWWAHPLHNASLHCVESIAKVVHYPLLDGAALACEDTEYWRRGRRDECLEQAIRNIELSQETLPKAEKVSMNARFGDKAEQGIIGIQKEIPTRNPMDSLKIAGLIAACKSLNFVQTDHYFGELEPIPYNGILQSIMTGNQSESQENIVSNLLDVYEKNRNVKHEERNDAYKPHVPENAELKHANPKPRSSYVTDANKVTWGSTPWTGRRETWGEAIKDTLTNVKDVGVSVYEVTKPLRGAQHGFMTSLSESNCYRDGLKAIGQHKNIPEILLEACSDRLPIDGDMKTRCMREGMKATGLDNLVTQAVECDQDLNNNTLGLGDLKHFVTGLWNNSCYQKRLGEAKKREEETRRREASGSPDVATQIYKDTGMSDSSQRIIREVGTYRLMNEMGARSMGAINARDSEDQK